jgi:hypothetical protein
VHCAAEQLDTSTPNGRFIRDIHLANAVREREEHVDRFESGAAWRPRPGCGSAARHRPATTATRRHVGSSQAPTPTGSDGPSGTGRPACRCRGSPTDLGMTTSGVRQLLRNRVYLGELRVGSYVNATAHEPLVTVDESASSPRCCRGWSDAPAAGTS